MTLDFSSEVGVENKKGTYDIEGFDFDAFATAAIVVDGVLKHEGFPFEAQVELLLTTADEVQVMNREARGIDAPTDVLSFPMIDFSQMESFEDLDDEDYAFHPDTGEVMLGDIVICYERVLSQAKEYGHSVMREFSFLIAHSMLHLLGYDHEDEAERMDMEKRQSDILNDLGITREE